MNKERRGILTAVVIMLLWYFLGAICNWDCDPGTWDHEARAFLGFFSVASSVFSYFVAANKIDWDKCN